MAFFEIQKERAKRRRLKELKHVKEDISLPSNGGNDYGETVEIVAKKVGLSKLEELLNSCSIKSIF